MAVKGTWQADVAFARPAAAAREGGSRIAERVFQELVAAIRQMRVKPGTRVSESAIAESFGVSRTPVREAVSRLVGLGLVQVYPQVGMQVAKISVTHVADAVFVWDALGQAALGRACESATSDDELDSILDALREATARHDPEQFFIASQQVHQRLFAHADRPGVWDFVLTRKVHTDRVLGLVRPESDLRRWQLNEAEAIVAALQAGNASLGAAALHEHIERPQRLLPQLRERHPELFSP